MRLVHQHPARSLLVSGPEVFVIIAMAVSGCHLHKNQRCALREVSGSLVVAPGGEQVWSRDGHMLVRDPFREHHSWCVQAVSPDSRIQAGENAVWILDEGYVKSMTAIPCTKPIARELKTFGAHKDFRFTAVDSKWLVLDDQTAIIVGNGPGDRYGWPPEHLYIIHDNIVRDSLTRLPPGPGGSISSIPERPFIDIRRSTDGKMIWVATGHIVCRLDVNQIRAEAKDAKNADECKGRNFPARVVAISSATSTGPIWVATEGGVYYWSGDMNDKETEILSMQVNAIARDEGSSDLTWAVASDQSLFRLKSSKATPSKDVSRIRLPGKYQRVQVVRDHVLLLSDGGVYECTNCRTSPPPEQAELYPLAVGSFTEIAEAPKGALWLSGIQSSALCKLKTVTLVAGIEMSTIVYTLILWGMAIACLFCVAKFQEWLLGLVHGWWLTALIVGLVAIANALLLTAANIWVTVGLSFFTCIGVVLLHPLFTGCKILFVTAWPEDDSVVRLRTDREFSDTEEVIQGARYRERVSLVFPQLAASESKLRSALLRKKPHVVHISGHCSQRDGLLLENKTTGAIEPVTPERLQSMFVQLGGNVRLVVLNACWSADHATALVDHVDFVVGMRSRIADDSASNFSVAFYDGIAHGLPVGQAFALACDILPADERNIPMLKSRIGRDPERVNLLGPRRANRTRLIRNTGSRGPRHFRGSQDASTDHRDIDPHIPAATTQTDRGLVAVREGMLEIHPDVQWPREVVVGERFAIRVAIHRRPGPHTKGSALVWPDQSGTVTLDIAVHLPDGGVITTDQALTQLARMDKEHDSPTLEFSFTACATGYHELAVSILHGGLELLRVSAKVLVCLPSADRALDQASALAVVTLPASQPDWVVLRIDDQGEHNGKRLLRLSMRGPSALLPHVPPTIREVAVNASELLVKTCRAMETTLAEVSDPSSRELRLCSLCAGLASGLLTPEVADALRQLPEGTALHIESVDAWVPWEAVRVGDGEDGFFLGERFAITRSLLFGAMDTIVPGGPAVLVAPEDAGLEADAEREMLAALAAEPPEIIGGYNAVWHRMRSTRMGFFHFVCHGRAEPESAHGGILQLRGGSRMRPMDIPGQRVEALASTCVFVNACQAGIETRTLYDHAAWSRAFLAAGAGVVIAPSWSVEDHCASMFAQRFYQELGKGHTFGEAARLARLSGREPGSSGHATTFISGNPDRLAYAVFAAPYTRLAHTIDSSTDSVATEAPQCSNHSVITSGY